MTDTLEQRKQLENLLLSEDLEELNNKTSTFNIFNALKLQNNEIRHSNFLGWLMSPYETHKIGDYFLKEFLKSALKNYSHKEETEISLSDLIFFNLDDAEIRREYKNIDLLVISAKNNFIAIIENKVWTGEHDCQLERYAQIVDNEFADYRKLYIYLAPNNEDDCELLNRNYDDKPVYYIPMNYKQIYDVLIKTLKFKSDNMTLDVRTFIEHYKNMIERNIMGIQDKEIVDLCRKIYRENKNAIDMIISCTNISDVIMEHVAEIYDNDLIYLNKGGMFSIKSFKNCRTLQCGDREYCTDLVLLQLEKGRKGYSFCINVVPAKNGFEAQRKEIIAKLEQKLNRKLVDSEKENTWCYCTELIITESEFYDFKEAEQIKDFLKKKIDETCFIPLLKELATNI